MLRPVPSGQQLSLDVRPHQELPSDAMIYGTLKIAGEYRVPYDLNPGDRIRVIVQSADGEVLDQQEAEVGAVGVSTVFDDNIPLGTERQHKAKIVG